MGCVEYEIRDGGEGVDGDNVDGATQDASCCSTYSDVVRVAEVDVRVIAVDGFEWIVAFDVVYVSGVEVEMIAGATLREFVLEIDGPTLCCLAEGLVLVESNIQIS